MQSSLWYWWLSHFVAFLAIVPWPGCSLIHNQNIKSIVLSSGGWGTVTNLIKLTLSLGWGTTLQLTENYKMHRSDLCTCPHSQRVKYFTRCFWYSSMAKRLRLKCLSYHRNWPGTFFPLTLSAPSYSSPLKPLEEVVWHLRQEDKWTNRKPWANQALRERWTVLYSYFSNQTQWQFTFKPMFTLLKATFQTQARS